MTLVLQRLSELESIIERGLGTFVEVGEALLEIRDSRLYRESHGTFEDYCQERWGFSDRRARQLMDAAEVGTIVPVANEGQARELAPLREEPEQMTEVWTEATERAEAEDRSVTAQDVREVVESRQPERKKTEHETCPTCGQRIRANHPFLRRLK